MIINKTRKAIIELIEPFMDKSLCKWCIINYWGDKFLQIMDLIKNEDYFWAIKLSNNDYWNYWHFKKNIFKYDDFIIIGHYDITAVLKYINKWENFVLLWDNWNKIEIHNRVAWDIWYFTTKPLHLYTEEEDKLLLELLLKIKNKIC